MMFNNLNDSLTNGLNGVNLFAKCYRESLQEGGQNRKQQQQQIISCYPISMHGDGPRFNPYSDEGGTTAAIAGEDFVIMAGDTRLSNDGFNILSRAEEKIFALNDKVILASAGFLGDMKQLVRVLQAKFKVFKYNYLEDMDIDAAACMLSRTLYYKRFFPYYTKNIIAGLNSKGEGRLYSYDVVGNIESRPYSSGGHGEAFIEPFFDNEIGRCNNEGKLANLTKDQAQKLMMDAFRGAAERETSTGDSLFMMILQKGKSIEIVQTALRAD